MPERRAKFLFLRKKLEPLHQPQEGTADCDKQKNSEDSAAEEQIHAFPRSQYLSHTIYNGPKRRWFTMAIVPPRG